MEPLSAVIRHDSIAALSTEEYVDRLYASLAWEGAIQLGDVAMSSRLVERVLRRAWDERDRFATVDAFLRHACDATRDAIRRENERRTDVMRFDDAAQRALPVPGDLHIMSVEHVRRRLMHHSLSGEAPDSGLIPQDFALEVAVNTRTALPLPVLRGPVPPPAVVTAGTQQRPAIEVSPVVAFEQRARQARALRLSEPEHLLPAPIDVGSAAPQQGDAVVRPLSAPLAPPHPVRERPHLKGASYIRNAERPTIPPRVLAIGVGTIAIVALLAWRFVGGPSAESLAIAALDAPAGVSDSTSRGEQATVALPGGSVARLGADASVRASSTFGDGARALTLSGPVSLSIVDAEDSPVALSVGTQRFVASTGVVAFANDGDRVLMLVDSGAVTHIGGATRTPVNRGTAVAVEADGSITALDAEAADDAFAWRRGRLQLHAATLLTLRERVQRWFGLDVTFATPRPSGERIALSVPLASVDSLMAAMSALGDGRVARDGNMITVGAEPARSAVPAKRAVPVRRQARSASATRPRRGRSRSTVPEMPRIQPLPTIPSM